MAEVLAFQQRAIEAENEVIAAVKSDTLKWVQHEFGWWYSYTHKSDEHEEYALVAPSVPPGILIHETVYSLDGHVLLVDAVREFDNAQASPAVSGEEPLAYSLMLGELVPADTVLMLVPWPLAYGRKGSGQVPPYTNIRVLLTLHTSPYCEVKVEDGL